MRVANVTFIAACLLLCGCAGSGSSKGVSEHGAIAVTLEWPESTREIPTNAKSIRVVAYKGSTIVSQTTITRPAETGTLYDIPPGSVTLSATAYDGNNGNGFPLLRGKTNVQVSVGVRAQAEISLTYPVWLQIEDFDSGTPIRRNGSAALAGGNLRLAGLQTFVAGSAWSLERLDVLNGFSTTFEFVITSPGGTGDTPGADGIAFVVQNQNVQAVGGTARDMGYGGISSSFAIEFDTYKNAEYGDPDKNHLSIHTKGAATNSANESASIAKTSNIPNLLDGQVHVAKVDYDNGQWTVYVDDLIVPKLQATYNLNLLGLTDGRAYVGFTSATGSSYANYDIASWFFGSD